MTSLLNATQLGAKMGKSPGYVAAMKEAGYVFLYGNQTTFPHAMKWRKENPWFRSTAYYRTHRKPPAHRGGTIAAR